MRGEAQRATLELARRRVKRAAGQLREASADIAAALGDTDTVGVVHATKTTDAQTVAALVRLGLDRYGEVDVVVLARPGRAPHHSPEQGTGEPHDHRSTSQAERAVRA